MVAKYAIDTLPTRQTTGRAYRSPLRVLSTSLVVSDDLILEQSNDIQATVVNARTGTRLRLSKPTYDFLRRFATPNCAEKILPKEALDQCSSYIRLLYDREFLVEVGGQRIAGPDRLRAPVAYKFCNTPQWKKSEPSYDFVVVGIPYDIAGYGNHRSGPADIRLLSQAFQYQLSFDSERPRGWFDANLGRQILEGARIGDAGNVYIEYGEEQPSLFKRVGEVVGELRKSGSVVVALGGDQSISYPIIREVSKQAPLSVIQISAGGCQVDGQMKPGVTAKNIDQHLQNISGIQQLLHVGGSRESLIPDEGSVHVSLSLSGFRANGAEFTSFLINENAPVHLAIDMQVLGCASHNDSDIRWSLADLREFIHAIGRRAQISSIVVTGTGAPAGKSNVLALSACNLLLTAMSASFDQDQSMISNYSGTKPPFNWHTLLRDDPGKHPLCMIGVPTDQGNVVSRGAYLAPTAIRKSSMEHLASPPVGVDGGDVQATDPTSLHSWLKALSKKVRETVDSKRTPLILGGDHALSYAPIEVLQHHEDICVIWFDAHTDFSIWNASYEHNHKQVLRRVATLPRVRKIVQIGYRGITLDDERQLGAKATVITTAHARSITASELLALIPNDCRCYISIDIDVIDPLFAPGTSAPVPDGLSPSTITRMLQAIVKQRHIAGIDLMEVNPSLDENDATSRISAELIAAIAQNWAYQ